MKIIQYILLSLLLLSVGCNKDESGWVELDSESLFVFEYGATASTKISHSNMVTFGAISYPDGWTVDVSLKTSTITVTAPADADSGDEQGEITLYGYDEEGSVTLAYLLVAKTKFVQIDDPANDRQSNCMILTEPNTIYTFNPNRRGEEVVEQDRKAVSCGLIWRSSNMPVGYPYLLDDGSMGVYTISDIYDCDDDGETDDIVEGNAIFAAYDSSGDILWSWHMWVTASDPTQNSVTIEGVELLPRNLGAATNSVDSTDDLLTSYGLYYQWGRRDPFLYPYSYNAASSVDAVMYDEDGVYTTHELIDLTSSTGTLAYIKQNPMDFIMSADWKYIADDTLWGADDKKSIYDPSPKGWRVPSSADFAKFAGSGVCSAAVDDDTYGYGAEFGGSLIIALGRKVYLDGSTQNVSADGAFTEGGGYYWSRNAVAGSTNALSFVFYTDRNYTADISDDSLIVKNSEPMERGNGMQVRSVRDN